jgi:hypothetical protein
MSLFEVEKGVSIVLIEVGGREKSGIRSARSSSNNSDKASINHKKQEKQQLQTSAHSISLSVSPISCILQP